MASRTGERLDRWQHRVRTAQRLRLVPEITDAVALGTISWDHAVVLTTHCANPRYGRAFTDLAVQSIDLAALCGFERWAREVHGIANRLDADGAFDPHHEHRRNQLRLTPRPDGSLDIVGTLVGDLRVEIEHAIATETDHLWRRHRELAAHDPEAVIPPRHQLQAEALAELCRRAMARTTSDTIAVRPEAVIVIPADHPNDAVLASGQHVPTNTLDAILSDPTWRVMHLDANGVPLDLGRARRFASPDQRTAIAQRDGGCIFPGCDRPMSWTDIHHVTAWNRNGPTDLANLAALCRFHHGITHRNGWTMRVTPDQWFTWTTPAGHTIQSQRHGQTRAGPAPP